MRMRGQMGGVEEREREEAAWMMDMGALLALVGISGRQRRCSMDDQWENWAASADLAL